MFVSQIGCFPSETRLLERYPSFPRRYDTSLLVSHRFFYNESGKIESPGTCCAPAQKCLGSLVETKKYALPFRRRMQRPQSPRRDYLMRCAEKQLMPVPAINRALKIDPSMTVEGSRKRGAGHSHEEDQGKGDINGASAEGKAPTTSWPPFPSKFLRRRQTTELIFVGGGRYLRGDEACHDVTSSRKGVI